MVPENRGSIVSKSLYLIFLVMVSSSLFRLAAADNSTTTLPRPGSGSAYATACNNAWNSYISASASYFAGHVHVDTQTVSYGGSFTSWVTYYANASTLCDGIARLTQLSAVPISTGSYTGYSPITATSTYTYSVFSGNVGPEPTCSISPSDCDPLWSAYSSSLMQGNLTRTSGVTASTITAAPMAPQCVNQTAASQISSNQAQLTACGPCTIFGNDVQLVYFPVPTTVSRDMCASTPSATLTHYADDAVIEVFAGTAYSGRSPRAKNATIAVVDQHTFTSGTAYISIGTVYAADRCGTTQGATVGNAIIAMHSASVLSLRYSQYHVQYFALTNTQTGYPVSYADFNTPIPWSAYNGQAFCRGDYAGYPCSVIYENQFRPQLAIPPGIRQLNPQWSSCQLWYAGLYDPPKALQPQQAIEEPTIPPWQSQNVPSMSHENLPSVTTPTGDGDAVLTYPPTPGSVFTTTATETGVPFGSGQDSFSVQGSQNIVKTITILHTLPGKGSGPAVVSTEVLTQAQQVDSPQTTDNGTSDDEGSSSDGASTSHVGSLSQGGTPGNDGSLDQGGAPSYGDSLSQGGAPSNGGSLSIKNPSGNQDPSYLAGQSTAYSVSAAPTTSTISEHGSVESASSVNNPAASRPAKSTSTRIRVFDRLWHVGMITMLLMLMAGL